MLTALKGCHKPVQRSSEQKTRDGQPNNAESLLHSSPELLSPRISPIHPFVDSLSGPSKQTKGLQPPGSALESPQ